MTEENKSAGYIKNVSSVLWNRGIKLVLCALLIYILYRQIFVENNFSETWPLFTSSISTKNVIYLVIVLVLMPVNWGLESLKWQKLSAVFDRLPFLKSVKVVLAGQFLAIMTPSGIGEYGGRLLMMKNKDRWYTVVTTFVGSIAQNLVGVLFGFLGALFFFHYFYELDKVVLTSLIGICLTFVIVGFIVFYNIGIIKPILEYTGTPAFLKPLVNHVDILKKYSRKKLTYILLISFLRYTVYSLQYVLILKFFGVGISFFASISGVALIFLLQSGLPLPPVMGVIVRGELALLIWSVFSPNTLGILSATFALWIINLVIPALSGMLIVLNTNVLQSLGYDKNKVGNYTVRNSVF